MGSNRYLYVQYILQTTEFLERLIFRQQGEGGNSDSPLAKRIKLGLKGVEIIVQTEKSAKTFIGQEEIGRKKRGIKVLGVW